MADPNPELVEKVARAIDDANGCQVESPNWLSLQCATTALRIAGEWAAGVAENHGWDRPIDWWLMTTKKDATATAAYECATAIRKEFGVSDE